MMTIILIVVAVVSVFMIVFVSSTALAKMGAKAEEESCKASVALRAKHQINIKGELIEGAFKTYCKK